MKAGKLLAALSVGLIASLFLAASAMAGIRVTVTTTADPTIPITPDGQCSLREAIGASNTSTTVGTADCPTSGSPPENQIGFDAALGASPVINLNLANPNLAVLNNDVTITGPATVNGATNSGFRVITSSNINLTLTSLTISNGSENVEGLGGGIRQINGRLFLNNSTVSGNTTSRNIAGSPSVQGGGIYSTGPVTLTDSVVSNNQAIATTTGGGTASALALAGGVEVDGEDITMENSVASGNQVIATGNGSGSVEADGGGVRGSGDVRIEHSTINGNLASATSTGSGSPFVQAGGLLAHGDSVVVDVELSTIANNRVKVTGPSPTVLGAGVEDGTRDTDSNYISDTIVGNGLDPASATGDIQGLNFQSNSIGTGSRTFNNTIIANPVGSAGSNCFGDTPYSDDSAPHVEFPSSISDPCFDATHLNVMHADPLLGALGNSGGPTPTMVPAPNSPVIDQGTADAQNDLTEDQRGLTRPVLFSGLTHPFDGSDIGAVEVQLACAGQATPSTSCAGPPTPTPMPPGATGQRAKALKKCKKIKAKTKAKAQKRKRCIKRAKKLPV